MGQQRTERKRAEKAANREAKAARKEVHVVEDKKKRISNGVLALMIFGVFALMFVSVWGYNYAQKEASIESYIANHGGEAAYSNMAIAEGQTLSVTAKKNDMKVVFDVKADDAAEQEKYFKGDEGSGWMKYVGAYYLATTKPACRGISASATCIANINGKEAANVEVKWSDVDGILEKYETSVDQIQEQMAKQAEQTVTTE
ncbi:MAG: hypothetical protein KBS56_04280 [Clostridiales bacterium]|nr:hypothetical protein [Candidatus Crickella equi]